MRTIIALVILLPQLVFAQSVVTESFSITLPDNLKVETDKVKRILAFGTNRSPFISIEFGKEIAKQYPDIVSRVNETLSSFGTSLKTSNCGESCEAMYAKAKLGNEHMTAYSYYYVVKSNKQSFVISITSQDLIDSGELEITNIANQILQSGI